MHISNENSLIYGKTPFERMADGMEDITPTGDGGVLKKILKNGVGSIVPQGAALKGLFLPSRFELPAILN